MVASKRRVGSYSCIVSVGERSKSMYMGDYLPEMCHALYKQARTYGLARRAWTTMPGMDHSVGTARRNVNSDPGPFILVLRLGLRPVRICLRRRRAPSLVHAYIAPSDAAARRNAVSMPPWLIPAI
jgi:hypothetical protein